MRQTRHHQLAKQRQARRSTPDRSPPKTPRTGPRRKRPLAPQYACKEFGGAGWAATVLRCSKHTAIVRFTYAKNFTSKYWARDWRALALTQVHHGSRLSDSCEGGEALSVRALDRPRSPQASSFRRVARASREPPPLPRRSPERRLRRRSLLLQHRWTSTAEHHRWTPPLLQHRWRRRRRRWRPPRQPGPSSTACRATRAVAAPTPAPGSARPLEATAPPSSTACLGSRST